MKLIGLYFMLKIGAFEGLEYGTLSIHLIHVMLGNNSTNCTNLTKTFIG